LGVINAQIKDLAQGKPSTHLTHAILCISQLPC
jgi:hypothetical protein